MTRHKQKEELSYLEYGNVEYIVANIVTTAAFLQQDKQISRKLN